MPESTDTSQQSREQLQEFRRIVSSAVGELRASQVRDAYAALSIEELMDQHVERMSGTGKGVVSRKQRLEKLYDQFTGSIEAMKNTDPSRFRIRDTENDVNTPRDTGESNQG